MDSCSINSPFSQICHFCENRQLSVCLFCYLIVSILAKFTGFAKYVIFVKPTIIDMPLLSSCFNFCQECLFCALIENFCQTFDKSKLANFAKFVIFVKPTIIDRPVSSSCFNFYQSFYKFLPNLAFSQNSQLSTCLVCHLIWILTNLKWIVAQFAMFVIIACGQDAPFCHFFVNSCQTFDNFLPNSRSSQNMSLS